jgi:hypothetical protein
MRMRMRMRTGLDKDGDEVIDRNRKRDIIVNAQGCLKRCLGLFGACFISMIQDVSINLYIPINEWV